MFYMKVCRVCQEFYSLKNMKVGLAPHFYNLAIELKKLGIDQTIIASHADEDYINGIEIFKIGSETPFSYIRSGLTVFKKIKELGEKFDIVHYHNPSFGLINLKRHQLCPIVMTLHGSPLELMKNIRWRKFREVKETLYYYHLTKFASKRLDALVCGSPGVRNSLIEKFKLDSSKVFFIPPGVDTDIFYQKDVRRDIDILYVGRFAPVKRHVDVLKAIVLLKKNRPNIVAYFIGGSPSDLSYSEVISFIKKFNIEKNVKIIKEVPQSKLREFYQGSKMLVLTSVAESSPKVTLEAMACGTPVVSSNIIGIDNILEDEKTGFLVPPKRPDILAGKIEILIRDKNLRKRMGKFGRKRVENNFIWEMAAEKYLKLYNTLIS